ncbi:TPA: hypothetical protein RK230_002655 [Enterobacter asburiae]|nr:hypothetical protein [Enterobacter asburiae]
MRASIWKKKKRVRPDGPVSIAEASELLGVSPTTLVAYHQERRIHLYALLNGEPCSFRGFLSRELIENNAKDIAEALYMGCAIKNRPHPLGLKLSKVSTDFHISTEEDCFWCTGIASGYWAIPSSFPIRPNEPIRLNKDTINNYLEAIDERPDGVGSLDITFTGDNSLVISMNETFLSAEDIERVYEAAQAKQALKTIGDNTDGRAIRYTQVHSERRLAAEYVLNNEADKCKGKRGFITLYATIEAIKEYAIQKRMDIAIKNDGTRCQKLREQLKEWFPETFRRK